MIFKIFIIPLTIIFYNKFIWYSRQESNPKQKGELGGKVAIFFTKKCVKILMQSRLCGTKKHKHANKYKGQLNNILIENKDHMWRCSVDRCYFCKRLLLLRFVKYKTKGSYLKNNNVLRNLQIHHLNLYPHYRTQSY